MSDLITSSSAVTHDDSVLDNAAWSSLSGAHAHLAEGDDLVRRYPTDVSPFAGVRDWDQPGVWDTIVALVGPGGSFPAPPNPVELPAGWTQPWLAEGVQLVATDRLRPQPDDEAVVLGADDVPAMLDLVARAQPGPFLPRTHLLGRYVGIKRDGRLVAMAGERLRPTGWTEISAVATDEEFRNQGLATRLVLDVAFAIEQRGDRPMMHAAAGNERAIRIYERLGFELRRRTLFGLLVAPEA